MFKSYQVGTIYGIPFKLDVTFLVILPVFAGLLGAQVETVVPAFNDAFGTTIDPATLTAGVRSWLVGFAAAVALFGCVALHELGHSAVAMSSGYDIESITLWLLGGLAKPAERPHNWVHELSIALAGPAVNVAIALGCVVVLIVLPVGDVMTFLVLYLALLNVALAVFNMLPAFPLDGGRVLRALLARKRTYLEATRLSATVGKGFALLLAFVGLATLDFIMVGIALFVYLAATSETRQMMLDAALDGVTTGQVMTPADDLPTVEADLGLDRVQAVMGRDGYGNFPVLDRGTFVGVVTVADIRSSELRRARVSDVMTPVDELPMVRPSTAVLDTLEQLDAADAGWLPVVDGRQRLCGLVSRADVARALERASEQGRHVGNQPLHPSE